MSYRVTQVESEFSALLELLLAERISSFLEVGSRFGGSLWRIADMLEPGARIVSVDSGRGMGGGKDGAQASLRRCVSQLCARGFDARLIIGDSQLAPQIKAVTELGPYDAVFIDADHEYRGVKRDWENYGRQARIVAFHDIAWIRPAHYPANTKQVEVGRLWNELKGSYRHREFIDRSTGGNMGIGVLWR